MSLESVPVTVRWLTAAEGGRRQPFVGSRYCPTAVVDGSDGRMWSAVVEFDTAARPTVGRFRFLFPDAPHALLVAGACVQLCEGPRVVAHGQVAAQTLVASGGGP